MSAMGSDTVSAALRAAARDERARAILLRVNSPGGSAVASDTIWREVARARAGGTPVVVSMGDVAASGGYFISVAADVIVAQPGTITGSIGVIMAKPVLRELMDRAGISTDSVAEGEHATMFAPTRRFSAGRVGQDQHLAGPDLRGLHRQGRRRAQAVARAGGGGRPRPGLDRRGRPGPPASWTSSAGWTSRRRMPAAGPGCPPTPRCGRTRGTARSTGSAARPRVRSRPLPRGGCRPRAGARSPRSPPGPACRRTDRCCCRETGRSIDRTGSRAERHAAARGARRRMPPASPWS